MRDSNFKLQRRPSGALFKNYLKYLGIFFVFYIIVAPTLNIMIDPKGYFFLFNQKSLNSFKPFSNGNRVQKSLLLKNGNFDALIAGTSRAEMGIDPKHPKLNKYKTFNVGLIASNIFETHKVLQFAQKHQDIKLLIWGIDLFSFNANVDTQQDYNLSLFADEDNIYRIYLGYLLSFKTLKTSFKTFKLNFSRNTVMSYIRADGFRATSAKHKVPVRHIFRRTIRSDFIDNDSTYSGFSYDDLRLFLMRETLDRYSKKETQIVLFISPVHAWQLELIDQLGLFDHYERMKRDLVKMVVLFNAEHKSATQIKLWDFGTYHPVSTEKIPPEDDSETQLNWFWESSHYKKELGDRILSLILEEPAKTRTTPEFGVLLSPENIDREIAELERQKLKYQMENPGEVQEITRLIDVALKR